MSQISTNITPKYRQTYLGAGHYDSDILNGWLSVDPMADDFLYIYPYNYCNWNPVKLKDPNGEFPFVTNIADAVISVAVEYGSQVIGNCINDNELSIGTFTNVDVFDLGVAAVEGFVTSGTNIAKKAVVKTATEVIASGATNAVNISTDKGFEMNNFTETCVGVVADRVGEIKVLNKKLNSPIPKSANKAARAKKGTLPTKQAKQIAQKQRKINEGKKTVSKMIEDQIQKSPSKISGAVIKGVNEKVND